MIVYLICNIHNGKVYVGQTIQPLKNRWGRHVNDSEKTDGRPTCIALCNAMKKYGVESFRIEKIGQANSREELNELERYWIAFFDSTKRENGYNLKFGGDGPQHTEETKIKISNSGRGQKRSEEFCDKQSKRMMGNKICEGRVGVLSGMFGKTHSEETKEKMSQSPRHNISGEQHPLYGRARSEEAKEAISKSLEGNQYRLGIPHPQEIKDRISASLKKAYAEGRKKKTGGGKKGDIHGPMPEEIKLKIAATMVKVRKENPWSTSKKSKET